jgi:hypothetical protein
MARRFSTGAEEADVISLWDYVTILGNDNQVGMPSLGATEQITWQPRTGRGMYCMNIDMRLRFNTFDFPTELYTGLAWRMSSPLSAGFIQIMWTDAIGDLSNYIGLYLNADGSLSIYRSGTAIATSPVGTVVANTWYYIEGWWKPRNTSGRVTIKVDGTIPTNLDFTGDTTNDLESIMSFELRGVHANNLSSYDDIVINDTSGSYNNSWPGMVRLMPIRPASAGNYSTWNRGGQDMGDAAAQLRYGSFDFSTLDTPSANNKHTFVPELPDLPANAAIQNILINAKAKVTSGSGFIAPMIRANGTDDIATMSSLLSSWRFYQKAWPINPNTSGSWIEANLANLEIGISS